MTRISRIVLVALVQVLFLVGMIASHAMVLHNGREVVLRTEPVDPRDLFRGDYVTLRYEGISTVPYTLVEDRVPLEVGDRVYVSLAKDEAGWQVSAVHEARPATDAPVMRGRITRIRPAPRRRGTDGEMEITGPRTLHIRYGIESYFVPEGKGQDLEQLRDEERLQVRVALASSGRAVIKGLLLDGELIHEEGLF